MYIYIFVKIYKKMHLFSKFRRQWYQESGIRNNALSERWPASLVVVIFKSWKKKKSTKCLKQNSALNKECCILKKLINRTLLFMKFHFPLRPAEAVAQRVRYFYLHPVLEKDPKESCHPLVMQPTNVHHLGSLQRTKYQSVSKLDDATPPIKVSQYKLSTAVLPLFFVYALFFIFNQQIITCFLNIPWCVF